MESGATFSMSWVTYDRKRKAGGRVLEVKEAKLTQPKEKRQKGRPLTKIERHKTFKSPNHRKWYTRNLVVFEDGQETSEVVKFHPPLVIEFNNMTVIE